MSEDHRAGLLPSPPERDSTLAFLREGYDFISNRCNALGSDAFASRLMLRPVTCLRGAEAATMFYAPGRMSRRGAMPRSVVRLLQDHGSVQVLDGAAHRQRRALFLGAMTPERQGAARAFHAQELAAALDGPIPSPVRFDRLIEHVFCCTALRWSGIPCSQRSIYRRTQELVAMFASAGRIGPARLRAACLRERSERWARKEIAMARAEPAASGWLVDALIAHRDTDGAALDDRSAAVELLNVLRPIVAVSRFATYALHAMAVHPEAIEWLWSRGDEDAARAFGDEVRRLYPFFPVIGGTVRTPFTWRGLRFEAGEWLLLDLHGTCRDSAAWPEALRFDPARHLRGAGKGAMIPQGGGDMDTGHRCPGEPLTQALLTETVAFLSDAGLTLPDQDLSLPRNRFPPRPLDGLLVQRALPASDRAHG